jgi:phospholipid/cholesterol/gamma-HCH transport system ATP-binding protein
MKKRAGLARALAMDPEIILFDEPDSGLDPVRVSYLDELVKMIQEETGATFVIITHNIASVMRTSDYIAVLYQANLDKFAAKEEMRTTDNPLIRQFLAGRAMGPIGMDELATERTDVEKELMDRERRRLEADGRDVDDYDLLTV